MVEAVAQDDTALAAAILESVPPESPDGTTATVASCIGVALGLLDEWLAGADAHAPKDLDHRVRLPSGHWFGERAATDVLALPETGTKDRPGLHLTRDGYRHHGRHSADWP